MARKSAISGPQEQTRGVIKNSTGAQKVSTFNAMLMLNGAMENRQGKETAYIYSIETFRSKLF
jgi:hypothetical protein